MDLFESVGASLRSVSTLFKNDLISANSSNSSSSSCLYSSLGDLRFPHLIGDRNPVVCIALATGSTGISGFCDTVCLLWKGFGVFPALLLVLVFVLVLQKLRDLSMTPGVRIMMSEMEDDDEEDDLDEVEEEEDEPEDEEDDEDESLPFLWEDGTDL